MTEPGGERPVQPPKDDQGLGQIKPFEVKGPFTRSPWSKQVEGIASKPATDAAEAIMRLGEAIEAHVGKPFTEDVARDVMGTIVNMYLGFRAREFMSRLPGGSELVQKAAQGQQEAWTEKDIADFATSLEQGGIITKEAADKIRQRNQPPQPPPQS